jgi:hypothetical protein
VVGRDYAIWRAFANEYWPAHYFIDAQGRRRYHHFGEGHYDESEWQAVTHLVIFILTNSEFLRNLMRGRRHDSAAGWSA